MKVMGIKASSADVRYAVLEKSGSGNIIFCNHNENRLLFPKALTTDSKKLAWFFNEFDRLMAIHKVCKVVIKLPESGRMETNASRFSHYLDAMMLFGAERHNPPITSLGVQYRMLHTRSADVCNFVRSKGIPETPSYWNTAMGDAIAAALFGLE